MLLFREDYSLFFICLMLISKYLFGPYTYANQRRRNMLYIFIDGEIDDTFTSSFMTSSLLLKMLINDASKESEGKHN